MTEELEQRLSRLELKQLKDLAETYDIDCSSCESKEEYIGTISDSKKVTIGALESLFGKDIGSKSEAESKPGFGEAEELLKETKSMFNNGDYITTIDKATEAMDAGAKALNVFYEMGLSYAIRSSETMISDMKDLGIDASSVEEILENARQSHENQDYGEVGGIIGELRDTMADLYRDFNERISEMMGNAKISIDNAKRVGLNVSEAEVKLQNATQLLAAHSITDAVSNIKESEALVKAEYENKVEEIPNLISQASKVIEEAKYVNASVEEAEELLSEAQSAYDSEDYVSAIENANKATQSANESRNEQIERVLSLQEKMKAASSEEEAFEVPISDGTTEMIEFEEDLVVEEKKKTEVVKVCPDCGDEPTYVEQYQRYYCYTCSTYVEPEEKEIEVKAEAVAVTTPEKEAVKVCPTCGDEPTYVEQYQKYYCYTCSKYVEPKEKAEAVAVTAPKKEAVKVCPTCGDEPTYVEQYQKYYCYTCSKYVEPKERAEAAAVTTPKKEVAKVCPTCGGEPTYVAQYQKYYCYTCSKYIEPVEKKAKAVAVTTPKKEAVKVCPTCGGEPTYVAQYQKYYCYKCSKYVEPVEKKAKAVAVTAPKKTVKVCPTCGGEPSYVQQYKKYYCYTCNKYVQPIERTSKPQASTTTCPTCGGKPTYVEQYKRYYCYTCNKYL